MRRVARVLVGWATSWCGPLAGGTRYIISILYNKLRVLLLFSTVTVTYPDNPEPYTRRYYTTWLATVLYGTLLYLAACVPLRYSSALQKGLMVSSRRTADASPGYSRAGLALVSELLFIFLSASVPCSAPHSMSCITPETCT
jgi:hypothetical protein